MPAQRRQVLEYLLSRGHAKATKAVATELGLPTSTTKRVLEDLAAHGVLERQSEGKGKPDVWSVAGWVREAGVLASGPETSEEPLITPNTTLEDISGSP